MTREELRYVQDHIDYNFRDTELLAQAFTRRSYAAENGGADNEILEFIGDKVLDLVVVKYLSDSYCYYEENEDGLFSDYDEGEMTKMKSRLVQKKMLSHRIDMLGFADLLLMGRGDIDRHVEKQDSVKEDLFEAIVGAVAMDSGWDLGAIEKAVTNMLDPEAELDDGDEYENYIGMVQDWCMETAGELPLYHVEPYRQAYMYSGQGYIYGKTAGTHNFNRFKYMCYFKFPQRDEIFLEFGESEREARCGAAECAYQFLVRNELLRTIRDEIEDPNFEDSIGQLETLARRGYFSIPYYDFKETHDENGNPVWDCKCSIKEKEYKTEGRSSSKKDAKKQAAFDMLERVMEE